MVIWKLSHIFIVAPFTNLDRPLIVDYSTSVGDVVYTLINQNEPVDVEIESNTYFELNPNNDRKYNVVLTYVHC